MKKFPNTVIYSKSHKKKLFKGHKAQRLFAFTTGIRIKKSTYLSFNNFESIRKILVRSFRPKGPKDTKNQAVLKGRQSPKVIQKTKGKYTRHVSKMHLYLKKKEKKQPFRLRSHIYSPITKKPLQVRMGKGKGAPYTWVSPTPHGKVTVEISRKSLNLIKLRRFANHASRMLPGGSKLIYSRKHLRKEHNGLRRHNSKDTLRIVNAQNPSTLNMLRPNARLQR
jgi:uncharacterized C2H2 Zn-finger protein